MENSGLRDRPRLGPRPVRGSRSPESMSASRLRLVETLEAQPEPTTLAALTAATGLHANTVREHLDALQRRGLVTRHRAAPEGRGRPAWLYQAADSQASEYAGLAAALAGAIHRSSDTPAEDAAVAGAEWGHELARGHGGPADRSATAIRREVVSLLGDIGFAPEADLGDTRVRLTRCPLLEAAHKHPDIVCAVHLGLVRGALAEYGDPGDQAADTADPGDQTADPGEQTAETGPAAVRLLPFAEPGACLLHLADAGSPR